MLCPICRGIRDYHICSPDGETGDVLRSVYINKVLYKD